jgi:Nucleotidyl transferase AbiEii toxin, Type IV TA system
MVSCRQAGHAKPASREWNRLLTSGGRGRKLGKPLSRETVRNIAGLVSSAYTRGMRWGIAEVNPVKASDPPDSVQIKIEVTPVLRGCVYEPAKRSVSPTVEDQFGFGEIQVVSFADLYAGKLVATLGCKHPRDLLAAEASTIHYGKPSSYT